MNIDRLTGSGVEYLSEERICFQVKAGGFRLGYERINGLTSPALDYKGFSSSEFGQVEFGLTVCWPSSFQAIHGKVQMNFLGD